MPEEGLEKRTCARFRIPGATIAFKREKSLFKRNSEYGGEFLPMLDISRGGIRFLSTENLPLDTRLHLSIQVPGDPSPLKMDGLVRWAAPNIGQSFKYQLGVQFAPYGDKKGMNYPGSLVKIIAFEQKFLDETSVIKDETGGRGSTFSI
ncbi:MAG: PilZ domain-containing protein [Candidatus Aminicenantes bacterium]|nr:PilZ domain-containing protein [Candidatus Aminicenantes bacterium]